ncbi:hypothetical protein EIN_098010 [Entamoeba invadens IP1]|uniref:Uncharacterized protein n=1 Tax=Entamoeba invadens IP1 TaxID=370355 RepID=A0A0A1U0T8_ENTIV|nr:hypothetical protein EIN_098010 [Entamoeba invadens IP1]ELP87514.1 hypothetical protein EIN_098010 [Entamoeba invadens IP1]|eukprot:XP_004254285.1 hypothetical protein EIN_098010 [Entamoeba invadens IP1]
MEEGKKITPLQAQYNMHIAHEQLAYRFFTEMQKDRKAETEKIKKWNDEERILRAQQMYDLEDGRYYIQNGTVMYLMPAKDIVSKTSVN